MANTTRVRLPMLDVPAVTATAAEQAQRALSQAVNARGADPRSIAEFASTLVLDAETKIKEASSWRDKLMLSLVVHEGYPAMQVSKAAGTSRAWMLKMLDRKLGAGDGGFTMKAIPKDFDGRKALASKAKVPFYRQAAAELPIVATDIIKAKATIDAAMPVRDDAARALSEAGTTREEIAKIIGRNPSRVSHLTKDPVAL